MLIMIVMPIMASQHDGMVLHDMHGDHMVQRFELVVAHFQSPQCHERDEDS